MLDTLMFVRAFLSQRLRLDDRGVTAVEYGLMLALIAGAIILIVTTLGKDLAALFTKIDNAITGA